MSFISESGAITDPNEIAATDYLDANIDDFFEEHAPRNDETPDENEALAVLNLQAELQTNLESLFKAQSALRQRAGINREVAANIQSITASCESMQSFFSGRPMNSYTEGLSQVNYKATQEGLVSSLIGTILKLIKTVLGYLWNLVSKVFDFFFGSKQKLAEVKKVDPATIKVFEEKASKVPNKNTPDPETKAPAIPKSVNSSAPAFTSQPNWGRMNKFFYSMLKNKPVEPGAATAMEVFNAHVKALPEIRARLAVIDTAWASIKSGLAGKYQPVSGNGALADLFFKASKNTYQPMDKELVFRPAPDAPQFFWQQAMTNYTSLKSMYHFAALSIVDETLTVGHMEELKNWLKAHPAAEFEKLLDNFASLKGQFQKLNNTMTTVNTVLSTVEPNWTEADQKNTEALMDETRQIFWILVNAKSVLEPLMYARTRMSSTLLMFDKGFA